jgi:hypothetical protein
MRALEYRTLMWTRSSILPRVSFGELPSTHGGATNARSKSSLGAYAEPLRLFLLGARPFPDCMALHTWVSSLSGDLLATLHLPEAGRVEGFHAYEFAIPGICFRLLVARHMSQKWLEWSTTPGPHRLVGIVPDIDRQDVFHMAQRINRLSV